MSVTESPKSPGSPSTPEGPRRRPFASQTAPKAFHQTREFQIFRVLAGVLLAVLLFCVYFLRTTGVGSTRTSTTGSNAPGQAALHAAPTTEELAARDIRLHTLFEGSLADTRNGDGFLETQGYRRLLQIVRTYSPEEFGKLPRRKLDWDAAMADPDGWRGEIVWMRGVVADVYANRLKESVFGVVDTTQGILTDGDATDGVFFDMIDEAPPLLRRQDPVDVVGVFYRTVKYPTNKRDPAKPGADGKRKLPPYRTETPEGDVQEAPYLLVKLVLPVEKPKRDVTGVFRSPAVIFVIMGLAIAGTWLINYLVQRRRGRRRGPPRTRSAGVESLFEKSSRDEPRTAGPPTEV